MQLESSSYDTISFTKLATRQHTHNSLDTSGKWKCPCTHVGTAEVRNPTLLGGARLGNIALWIKIEANSQHNVVNTKPDTQQPTVRHNNEQTYNHSSVHAPAN